MHINGTDGYLPKDFERSRAAITDDYTTIYVGHTQYGRVIAAIIERSDDSGIVDLHSHFSPEQPDPFVQPSHIDAFFREASDVVDSNLVQQSRETAVRIITSTVIKQALCRLN